MAAGQELTTQAPADTTTTAPTDTTTASQASTVILPVIGYTPDTGLMLGAAVLRLYLEPEGPDTRPSVFSPTFIYTLKNQIMVFLGTEFNWDQGRSNAGLFPATSSSRTGSTGSAGT